MDRTLREQLFGEILAEVQALVDDALAQVGGSVSLGLADGSEVVLDYIEHNEGGVAFDHVVYMITEPPVEISQLCFDRLSQLGAGFGLESTSWEKAAPTHLFGVLPDQWTIQRIQNETPLANARLLPLRTPVFEEGVTDLAVLDPQVILDCDGWYLLVQDKEFSEWHMGRRDGHEILCWASCGGDLEAAIRML